MVAAGSVVAVGIGTASGSVVYGVGGSGQADSVLFTSDIGTGVTNPVGPTRASFDLEAGDVDAAGTWWLVSGSDASGGAPAGGLYTADPVTGDLTPAGVLSFPTAPAPTG
mgnify:FL=1